MDLGNEVLRQASGEQEEDAQAGWFQWLWGSPSSPESEGRRSDSASSWNFEFSAEQKKNFYASIGYDAEDSSSPIINFPTEVCFDENVLLRGGGRGRQAPLSVNICTI